MYKIDYAVESKGSFLHSEPEDTKIKLHWDSQGHFYYLVASDCGPEDLCIPHHPYTSNMSDQFSRINSLEMESQVHLKQPKVASPSWFYVCSTETPGLFHINYSLSGQIAPLLSWQN